MDLGTKPTSTMNAKTSGIAKESAINNGVKLASRPGFVRNQVIENSSVNGDSVSTTDDDTGMNITILKEYNIRKNTKKRYITIELHRIPVRKAPSATPAPQAAKDSDSFPITTYHDNVFLRIQKPASLLQGIKMIPSKSKNGSNPSAAGYSRYDDSSTIASLQLPSVYEHGNLKDSDSQSVSSTISTSLGQSSKKLVTRYLIGLRNVEIKQVANKRITLEMKQKPNPGAEYTTITTDLLFADIQQSKEFASAIDQQKILHRKRELEQLNLAFKDAGMNLQKEISLANLDLPTGATEMDRIDAFFSQPVSYLIEIVGCQNLIVADVVSSDPYVVAQFQNRTIHKTKHVSKSLNPVFTLRKNAFFLFEASSRDLFLGDQDLESCDDVQARKEKKAMLKAIGSNIAKPLSTFSPTKKQPITKKSENGITLEVFDYDAMAADTTLGTAIVTPKDIYNGKEERLEYPLVQNQNQNVFKQLQNTLNVIKLIQKPAQNQGKIAIRIRRATDYDKKFVTDYSGTKVSTGVLAKAESPDNRGSVSIKSMASTKVKTFIENGRKLQKFKVLPRPDPDAEDVDAGGALTVDRKWLTAEEIEEKSLQPTRQFKYVGHGGVAKVFLEIISCSNLPNMETVGALGNKTDAFVQVVYEDHVCQTPVIDDKNNPRFLPWTNRAWVFHPHYPSSVINLGVFDFDAGKENDFIGRTVVNPTNFRPGTEYLLDYKLYDTAMFARRKDYGTIKIRLRIEVDDPRRYLLAGLSIPPLTYVNCSTSKEFTNMQKTCYGKNDMTEYSLETMYELLDELWKYGRIYYYVVDILTTLFLWRGTHNVTMGKKTVSLPVNSLCAFLMATTLVENPRLLPSFSFLTLAWMLMISLKWRADHPSPWYRSKSMIECFQMLILGGKAVYKPDTIAEMEREEEAAKFDFTWKELIEGSEKRAAERAVEVAKEQEQLTRGLQDVGGAGADTNIGTEKSKAVKIPTLGLLKSYLFPIQQMMFETCKWLRFAKNIILWEESIYTFWLTVVSLVLSVVFLFVPWFWIIKWSSRIIIWGLFGPWMKLVDMYVKGNEEDINAAVEADRLARKQINEKTLQETRVKNELAFKLRDFKQYFFGKYLTKVNILNFDRFVETPLPSSSAKPWQGKSPMVQDVVSVEDNDTGDREIGQQLEGLMIPKVQEMEPSATSIADARTQSRIDDKDDLSPILTMKIGAGVFMIAMITHYTVPVLIDFVQKCVSFLRN